MIVSVALPLATISAFIIENRYQFAEVIVIFYLIIEVRV